MKRDDMKAMLAATGRYIRRAFEPRIKAVEDRIDELPALVERAAAALPAPKNGTSVTPSDVEPMLRKMVDEIEIPEPAPVDVDAIAADAVKRLLSSEGLKSICALVAAEAVAELPPAPKGEDGKSVSVDDVLQALMPRLEDRFEAVVAKHLLDIERRAQGVLERAVAAIPVPKDGKDGRDGLSMADVTRNYDAETHEVVERWTVAGEQRELRYPAGGIRPGGFWREGMKCLALQAITHDGALWIAKRDTAAKPCLENADDWQLAARKGRDGRDGKDGKPPPGPVTLGGGNA